MGDVKEISGGDFNPDNGKRNKSLYYRLDVYFGDLSAKNSPRYYEDFEPNGQLNTQQAEALVIILRRIARQFELALDKGVSEF